MTVNFHHILAPFPGPNLMLKLGPIQVRWRDTINFGGGMTGSRGLPTKVRTLPQKTAKARRYVRG